MLFRVAEAFRTQFMRLCETDPNGRESTSLSALVQFATKDTDRAPLSEDTVQRTTSLIGAKRALLQLVGCERELCASLEASPVSKSSVKCKRPGMSSGSLFRGGTHPAGCAHAARTFGTSWELLNERRRLKRCFYCDKGHQFKECPHMADALVGRKSPAETPPAQKLHA